MFERLFPRPTISFILFESFGFEDYYPPTRQELKRQLAEATLWLARAKSRAEARDARKLIDVLLLDLSPVYPTRVGKTRLNSAPACVMPPKQLRLARAKYRR